MTMTLRKQFEKEMDWVNKYEQPMFLSIKYIHWLESKVKQQLQNKSSNSNYPKCEHLLHDAIGLLMHHEQSNDKSWKVDYEKLILSYQEQYPGRNTEPEGIRK
jgi:hypothetical protein